MAPKGKKFPKIPVFEMAKISGCVYSAKITVASPIKLSKIVRKAILIAREVGPTYVQIYTLCPTNLKFPPDNTIKVAKKAEKIYYKPEEFITPEAEEYLNSLKEKKKFALYLRTVLWIQFKNRRV
ncbi:thiamine pyrophosphate-dependent enzyme [Thermodesulfatator autotrophicus]|uniref:Thiamine pyrophosphate enzyme TPP-binding domain-containing protein n=1 Tax=Thermodesulfatator autotrophicus TaxID=1795632 RepID=A0A177E551_9BACT|nr:hypothetical protein [Thermodesulfatator autotrophicus]OAG26836.1 hypothetical protein TH606_10130 [Thermodesulfatator autotrophicus]